MLVGSRFVSFFSVASFTFLTVNVTTILKYFLSTLLLFVFFFSYAIEKKKNKTKIKCVFLSPR